MAWRMVVDLIAGVGVGAGMGYGLDALFGTSPVLLASLTLLGFAAGVRIMLGTARSMQLDDESGPKGQGRTRDR